MKTLTLDTLNLNTTQATCSFCLSPSLTCVKAAKPQLRGVRRGIYKPYQAKLPMSVPVLYENVGGETVDVLFDSYICFSCIGQLNILIPKEVT